MKKKLTKLGGFLQFLIVHKCDKKPSSYARAVNQIIFWGKLKNSNKDICKHTFVVFPSFFTNTILLKVANVFLILIIFNHVIIRMNKFYSRRIMTRVKPIDTITVLRIVAGAIIWIPQTSIYFVVTGFIRVNELFYFLIWEKLNEKKINHTEINFNSPTTLPSILSSSSSKLIALQIQPTISWRLRLSSLKNIPYSHRRK